MEEIPNLKEALDKRTQIAGGQLPVTTLLNCGIKMH